MTAPTPVLVEHRGPVAVVTLNRPDHLNALSPDNALPVLEALNELREDGSCRVVVLTGAGRAFCSGMDLVAGLDRPGHGQVQGRYLGLERAAEVFLALVLAHRGRRRRNQRRRRAPHTYIQQ